MKAYTLTKNLNSRTAQASLEMTVALVLILLLLMGAVKIFAWVNDGLIRRQVSYENTRQAAGNTEFAEVHVSSIAGNVSGNDLVITDVSGGTEVGFNDSTLEAINII